MIKETLTLSLGLLFLFVGSYFLVKSIKSLSLYLKLKPLFLSLVVLGFVSSSPELFVTLNASLKGLSSVALGNVLGSNVINILVVLGLAGLFHSLSGSPQLIRLDMPVLILGIGLLGVFAIDQKMVFLESACLLLLFFIYVVLLFRDRQESQSEKLSLKPELRPFYAFLFLIIGFAVLFLGSSLAVDSSLNLVKTLSLSEKFAGIFILSLSTSLPELASVLQASFKKESDIALGGIIGSNIFNTFFVLGTAGLLSSLSFLNLYSDYFFMTAVNLALFLCLLFFKKIPKSIFIAFIGLYFLYIAFIMTH